jgi:hypothetical protein
MADSLGKRVLVGVHSKPFLPRGKVALEEPVTDRSADVVIMVTRYRKTRGHGLLADTEDSRRQGKLRLECQSGRVSRENQMVRRSFSNLTHHRDGGLMGVTKSASTSQEFHVQPAGDSLGQKVPPSPSESGCGDVNVAEMHQSNRRHASHASIAVQEPGGSERIDRRLPADSPEAASYNPPNVMGLVEG